MKNIFTIIFLSLIFISSIEAKNKPKIIKDPLDPFYWENACFPIINGNENEDIKVSDKVLWQQIFLGNFSLAHKMILTREIKCTNDALMNQFMMAYCYFVDGDQEKVLASFVGIDNYVQACYMGDSQS